MNRPLPAGNEGFTLIEVMLAGFVLSVAVLGMLSLVTTSHGMTRDAWETTVARNAARDKLEEVKSAAKDDFYGVPTVYAGTGGQFDVEPLVGEEKGVPVGLVQVSETVAGNPNLIDVEVTIEWLGVGGSRTIAYRTRLSPF